MASPQPTFDRSAALGTRNEPDSHAPGERASPSLRQGLASSRGSQPASVEVEGAWIYGAIGRLHASPTRRPGRLVIDISCAGNKMPRGPGGALGAGEDRTWGESDLHRIHPGRRGSGGAVACTRKLRQRRLRKSCERRRNGLSNIQTSTNDFVSACFQKTSARPTAQRRSAPRSVGSSALPSGPRPQPFFSTGAGRRCSARPFSTFSASLSA